MLGLFLLLLFQPLPPAMSDNYCSLVVQVVAPNGKRPAADVRVTEENGRKLDQITDGMDARFCDLGVRPVTVEVGSAGTCNQVRVNSVPLAWGETYHLKITYDPVPCLRDLPHISPRYCTYVFRVQNEQGKWLPNATLSISPAGLSQRTDNAGRAMFTPAIGPFMLKIRAAGYGARSLEGNCTPAESHEPQERLIQLSAH
jgi:hypothetical protein